MADRRAAQENSFHAADCPALPSRQCRTRTFRRYQSACGVFPVKRPAEHDPRTVQRYVRRRVLSGNDLRPVHSAVHQRFHHHSAPVHCDPRSGASAEGRRRGRQEEDRQHHPLQHGRHRLAAGLCLLYDDAQLRPHERRLCRQHLGCHRHHPDLYVRFRPHHVAW